jgi:hypothetical protein
LARRRPPDQQRGREWRRRDAGDRLRRRYAIRHDGHNQTASGTYPGSLVTATNEPVERHPVVPAIDGDGKTDLAAYHDGVGDWSAFSSTSFKTGL